MSNVYKVLKINENTLDTYGDVYVVYANLAKPNPVLEGYYMVSETETRETELFVFPQDMSMIRGIDSVARMGRLWEPDERDFRAGGLTLTNNVRHTAHYHESLFEDDEIDDTPSPAIINYKAEEISFNNQDWIKFEEPQDWDFSLDDIRTPYGDLLIEGYMEVEQNGMVGVQLETDGFLYFGDIPSYPGDDEDVYVKTVAVMRQPNNIWLWLYLFDELHHPIVSICGLEGDVMSNELSNYLISLRSSSHYQRR